jgi:nitrite reductase/ring-hydroxylating ferredoxin subunit
MLDRMSRPIDRRTFCRLGAGVAGGALLALKLPGCGPALAGDPIIAVGTPAQIVMGQATFYKPQRLFVCRDAGGIFAVTSDCQHEHCDVEFVLASSSYLCPCHSSKYDYTGQVLQGPTVRPLFHLKVELDAVSGQVMVDSRTMIDAKTRL